MMSIIDHGFWVKYMPAQKREDAPIGAMFAMRESDSQDWYEYVHPGNQFSANTLKCTVRVDPVSGLDTINAPVVDATMLFPDAALIVEISGDYSAYTTDELIDYFAGKVIDLTTGDITDPPPAPSTVSIFDEIMQRLDKLEGKS
jgi:hypothetical protein